MAADLSLGLATAPVLYATENVLIISISCRFFISYCLRCQVPPDVIVSLVASYSIFEQPRSQTQSEVDLIHEPHVLQKSTTTATSY